MRSLVLLFLVAACEDPRPTSMDTPDLAPALDLTMGSANTFGCDLRSLGPSTNYCQDTTTTDPAVRAVYENSCTQNKGILVPGGCPHFTLGGCRSTAQVGPVAVTTTNWFPSYPGVSTSAQLAAVCEASASTYVAP
jgi:hypothetical protein